MSRLFVAAYDGTCEHCGDRFASGEEVGYSDDDELLCQQCWDTAHGRP